MADPRLISARGPFSLTALAKVAEGRLASDATGSMRIVDIAPLEAAERDSISFLDNKRYVEAFAKSRAGACIVHPSLADRAPEGMALVLSKHPYRAYTLVARAFYPPPPVEPHISPSAAIDPDATLGADCRVDPGAVIEPGSEIGARCHIAGNAVIGTGVAIGDDCLIGACASLSHCVLGDRVAVGPGARIGQTGFGFASGPEGHQRIPHIGRVVIHDDVEIGANTTIDRGTNLDTVIGAGCMIDNSVQIAHNVRLGRGCVIVAQVGISGSTKLGDFVVCGGQVGLAGHLTIGDRAELAARAGVTRDLEAGQTYGGFPAVPAAQWRRQAAALARLVKTRGKI